MRLVKIAVASVNPTVGAVRSNVDRCIALAHEMARADVTVAAFPEQVVGGYPTEDLIQWRGFVASQRCSLERFAAETAALGTVFALGLTVGLGGDLFNAAALVHAGRLLLFCPKEKLPTYNIFYESRTFSRGAPLLALDADGVPLGDWLVRFDFGTVALEVCEDLWSPDGPMRRRCYSGAELVLNLSASPFRAGIAATRREMIATRAADNQATVVYSNLVGGNDGLVFDGGGLVNQNGRPMLEAPPFREGFAAVVVDLDRTMRCRREASTWRGDCEAYRSTEGPVPTLRPSAPSADRSRLRYPVPVGYEPRRAGAEGEGPSFFLPPVTAAPAPSGARDALLDDFYEALGLGVADYFRKTGAFRLFGVATSGGRDSCLSLLVAWRAVQLLHPGLEGTALRAKVAELVSAFYLPTRFSGDATRAAAERIVADLGARFVALSIEEAFERELDATQAMLGADGPPPTGITRQNVQARVRGARMWNWSNSSGALFLQTGNMSEKALGYTTVGGDLEGAFSVIANLPKTVVIALLDRLYRRYGFEGIALTLGTVAGPELESNQAGEEELMPFPVLDACLYLYAAEKLTAEEVAEVLPELFPALERSALEAWAAKFAKLFTQSIFKWVQAPLTIHVGALDLDRERALQLPVVQRTEW
jgi:NAD+ synthase (glutamine-hydrolysing)